MFIQGYFEPLKWILWGPCYYKLVKKEKNKKNLIYNAKNDKICDKQKKKRNIKRKRKKPYWFIIYPFISFEKTQVTDSSLFRKVIDSRDHDMKMQSVQYLAFFWGDENSLSWQISYRTSASPLT